MTAWEYLTVPLERTGTKEDFSFTWTYGPWEITSAQGIKEPLMSRLQQLGREGWELAGVIPSDLWDEGGRAPNSAHGIRAISCLLVFKRPVERGA
jgi:hypothetical protein